MALPLGHDQLIESSDLINRKKVFIFCAVFVFIFKRILYGRVMDSFLLVKVKAVLRG